MLKKLGRLMRNSRRRQNLSQRTKLHDVLSFIENANSTQIRAMANSINDLTSIKRSGKEVVC